MNRVWAIALCAAALVSAEEITGKIAAVDATARTITIKAEGKDRKFAVHREVTVIAVRGTQDKKGKKVERVEVVAAGLSGLKKGADATVLTETQGTHEVVTSIKTPAAAEGLSDRPNGKKNKKNKPIKP